MNYIYSDKSSLIPATFLYELHLLWQILSHPSHISLWTTFTLTNPLSSQPHFSMNYIYSDKSSLIPATFLYELHLLWQILSSQPHFSMNYMYSDKSSLIPATFLYELHLLWQILSHPSHISLWTTFTLTNPLSSQPHFSMNYIYSDKSSLIPATFLYEIHLLWQILSHPSHISLWTTFTLTNPLSSQPHFSMNYIYSDKSSLIPATFLYELHLLWQILSHPSHISLWTTFTLTNPLIPATFLYELHLLWQILSHPSHISLWTTFTLTNPLSSQPHFSMNYIYSDKSSLIPATFLYELHLLWQILSHPSHISLWTTFTLTNPLSSQPHFSMNYIYSDKSSLIPATFLYELHLLWQILSHPSHISLWTTFTLTNPLSSQPHFSMNYIYSDKSSLIPATFLYELHLLWQILSHPSHISLWTTFTLTYPLSSQPHFAMCNVYSNILYYASHISLCAAFTPTNPLLSQPHFAVCNIYSAKSSLMLATFHYVQRLLRLILYYPSHISLCATFTPTNPLLCQPHFAMCNIYSN